MMKVPESSEEKSVIGRDISRYAGGFGGLAKTQLFDGGIPRKIPASRWGRDVKSALG